MWKQNSIFNCSWVLHQVGITISGEIFGRPTTGHTQTLLFVGVASFGFLVWSFGHLLLNFQPFTRVIIEKPSSPLIVWLLCFGDAVWLFTLWWAGLLWGRVLQQSGSFLSLSEIAMVLVWCYDQFVEGACLTDSIACLFNGVIWTFCAICVTF